MKIFQFLVRNPFFKQIGFAVLGFAVFLFLLNLWLGYITHHDQKIQVPNLQKMSLAEVQEKLKALNLEFIVIDSASYTPDLPKRSVVEQSPEAGDFVKEKRKIYLTLNRSKYRDVTIPDLNGRTKRQAITQLRSIGFVVGENFTFVQDIGRNVVRGLKHKGKRIAANDKLPFKSKIDLILGDGRGR